MQRYFISKEQFRETSVTVTGDDAHHIAKVMRARVGDRFICSNGTDREALVEITDIQKGIVEAVVTRQLEMTNEPAVQVWIAQSLTKGDKMETVIQKCTELGAARFIPFISERTVVQYDDKKEVKRLERWKKIAKEAAEQSHRNRVPAVDAPIAWKELLSLAANADASFICYEKEHGLPIREALQRVFSSGKPAKVLLMVGPEGGFTEAEIDAAESASCKSVGLGKRILRTETAAMVGLTCILYESGEMGGEESCRL